jgi:hypothetical protein
LTSDSEEKLVDQTFRSWNPLLGWLRHLQELRSAA